MAPESFCEVQAFNGMAAQLDRAVADNVRLNQEQAVARTITQRLEADRCAIARPHLANPAWTLTEAAKIGYTPIVWPKQYFAGKRQMESLFEREKAMK